LKNNTFEETVVFCIYSCNQIVYIVLSNIKYSMTRIGMSQHCLVQFALFYS